MSRTSRPSLFSAIIAWVLLLGVCSSARCAETTAIVGVDVVNPLGFPSTADATVLVQGDRIMAVGPRDETTVPDGARIVAGRGKWLIPGLMDLHVHFGTTGTLLGSYQGNQPRGMEETRSFAPNQGLFQPKLHAERTFRQFARSGVTTVRSLGEYGWAHRGPHALRPRAQRDPLAPRLVLSTVAYFPRSTRPSMRRITSPKQGVMLLRLFAKRNEVEFLKIWWVDGRFVGESDADGEWKEHAPIVKALLDESKKLGLRNSVDAIEASKAKEVVRMGGNLAHGIFFGRVDDELLDLMKANQTQITSTLVASARYFGAVAGHLRYTTPELLLGDPHVVAQTLDMRGLDTDQFVIPRGGSRFDGMTLTAAMRAPPYTEEIVVAVENLRRIHQAGIPVGIGTDCAIPGVLYGASIFSELGYHHDAGMSPHDVLTAATINNARILGLEDEIGSITVGKQADLVLLDADPREDVQHAAWIAGVMRAGRYFTAAELNDDTPADVVTRLRNAFNSGDQQAMTQLLHADAVLRDQPGDATATGRRPVLDTFARGSDGRAHRALVSSATKGNTVIQKERWPDGRNYVVRYVIVDRKVRDISVESVSDASDKSD